MTNKIVWRSGAYRQHVCEMLRETRDVILFDTETTGLSSTNDRIIEIAAIKYTLDESNSLVELDRLHQYIRPPFLISEKITELTGITNEFLFDYPYEEDCFQAIQTFFDNKYIISGHNVGFDIRFLSALYERNKSALDANRDFQRYDNAIDTLKMARDRVKPDETENYKLGTLAALFGLDEGVTFHSAIEDVQVTAKLFELFYKEYEEALPSTCGETNLVKPAIKTINFWEGFKGFSRIYVETEVGSVYYDIRRKVWAPKDADIDTIDMEYIENECCRITKTNDIVQFAKFAGRIKV